MIRCRPAAGVVAAALLAIALASPAPAARVQAMRLTAEADVVASPDAVWDWIANGKNLVTWCPVWKSEENAKVEISKVGDVLDFTDEWGNGGRSVVTYLEKGKELRVAHEPDNGSYVCQSKFTLAPTSTGTHVTWVEQYTDDQPAEAADATAADMQAGMSVTLEALKAGVEGAK
jgi:hypothetical protein